MTHLGIIQRLEETVVNKIAAGEVVQRPANALKELLENCLDANSSQISVTVKQGGLKILQIQDNGTGIRKSDMGIVCERFTTSKLREYGDLQQIATYGFRGEALASISHVSHLTIITKTKDDQCAWKCSYSDGKPKENPKPCAGNQGTQITVEDLFYNVPTRKKALNSAAEEHARIAEVLSCYAIHNASVGFSLKKQGESSADLRTSSHSTSEANIRTVFGGAVAKELLAVSCSDDGLQFSCSGLLTNANYCAKRCIMLLFINNRLVESRALRKVLETVYSNYLPKQSHPFIYLSLKIAPRNVDVNVHPTKHEVSFLHEDAIIAAIQKAVEDKLLGSNASKTFYTQSLLPGASSSEPSLEGGANGRVYDHSLVRTSAKEQKITKYWSSERTSQHESALSNSPPPSRREHRLTSVHTLLEAVKTDCHSGLQDILHNHSFVGCVDHNLVLIQHSTHLYLARTKLLSEQMFYQILLSDFGNFGVIKLSPPASIRQLALLALDQPESGWTEADGSKEQLADYILAFLRSKAAMLLDYFSITIDDDGCLTTLPYLIDDFLPCLTGLPMYALRLTTEVAWDSELDCFRSICRETAQFYASPPLPGETEVNPTMKDGGKDKMESKWCWQVEQLMFPALRTRLLPPKHLAHDTSLLQLVDLHHLYKVFERC